MGREVELAGVDVGGEELVLGSTVRGLGETVGCHAPNWLVVSTPWGSGGAGGEHALKTAAESITGIAAENFIGPPIIPSMLQVILAHARPAREHVQLSYSP